MLNADSPESTYSYSRMADHLEEVIHQFQIDGELKGVEPLKIGHINNTYLSRWKTGSGSITFVHQRISRHVFPNVPELMENVLKITTHVRKKIADERGQDQTLTVVPTKQGQSYLIDDEGEYWRTYVYVENSVSYYVCKNLAHGEEGARTCSRFQRYIIDLNPHDFHETIPSFHNTPNRYRVLREAITQDKVKRAKGVVREIDFAMQYEAIGSAIVDAIKQGTVPTRVTHNDLKFNNVLFDIQTDRGICVVDLDTCMPGSVLYDFGDFARNAAVQAAEDEKDLTKVVFDVELFEALLRGYLSELKHSLTPTEISLMAVAPKVIALSLGVRFLTDYLDGDHYFKVQREGHNLDRARTQFKIIESIADQAGKIAAIVEAAGK